MSSRFRTLFSTGLIVALAIGLLLYQRRRAHLAREELQQTLARFEANRTELRRLQAQAARPARNSKPLSGLAPGGLSPAIGSTAEEASSQQQSRRAGVLRAWVELRFGSFLSKLKLPPETVAKFEDLIVEHYQRMDDIAIAAQTNGVAPSDPSIAALQKQENRDFTAASKELLGPAASQEAKAYLRTAPVSYIVNGLAGNVYNTNAPLTAVQADQLTQIIANNSTDYQAGRTASPLKVNVDAVLAQAQTILAPSQLAALKGIYTAFQSVKNLQTLTASAAPSAAPAQK